MWDINANIHYLFDVADKIKVYPLVGIGYVHFGGSSFDGDYNDDYDNYSLTRASDYDDYDDSSSNGEIAVNIGCGVQYALTDKININAELKYQIIDNSNQIVPSIGVAFKF